MKSGYLLVKKSPPLQGTVTVNGAKNAALVIMASQILTSGTSTLENIPNSADVRQMITLLQDLGALVDFDSQKKRLIVDTTTINNYQVRPELMNKMRASILVTGPLLARFGQAKVAQPGGCIIGQRLINYHLAGLKKMGIQIKQEESFIHAQRIENNLYDKQSRITLEYPSVGATENLMMYAVLGSGKTVIINPALEPEVLDLIDVLKKMGAHIDVGCSSITIIGVNKLDPVTHTIIPDRLEAGALLLASAITGGQVTVDNVRADHLDLFLEKLREVGHEVATASNLFDETQSSQTTSITLKATHTPRPISIKTGPYPSFPTDLQAPMSALLASIDGISSIEETVFENRMVHTKELEKMGAQIELKHNTALIRGVEQLYGCEVIATDIRTSCALALAGLAALGQTKIIGIHHWLRGYDGLEQKLQMLGADIKLFYEVEKEEVLTLKKTSRKLSNLLSNE
ncbi:MAG: UDP-N-acetylglucosamine 1-carboxyvinyltransferase [Epsilonproteobacteria bacterium]|nr:UDP-N-acetylglucosamine 1-carboxyvinyltransferase [Campylobacterota bacterium]